MKNRPLLNVLKSPEDSRDYLASAVYPKIGLPEALDLRDNAQPIRDQGSQGACAAMAGAAMKEYQEAIDSGLKEYFSPQFIYNLRSGTQEGMYMRDLMSVLKKHGDCREATFKYGTIGTPPAGAIEEGLKYTIDSYAKVESVEELKTALFVNGPCIIAVPVYNYGDRMWYQYQGDEFLGGHAMAVYGWTEKGFIIRNSWGEDWGHEGYTYMPFNDFALAWEFWTTIDAKSYEPVKKNWFKRFWWIFPVVAAIIITIIFVI